MPVLLYCVQTGWCCFSCQTWTRGTGYRTHTSPFSGSWRSLPTLTPPSTSSSTTTWAPSTERLWRCSSSDGRSPSVVGKLTQNRPRLSESSSPQTVVRQPQLKVSNAFSKCQNARRENDLESETLYIRTSLMWNKQFNISKPRKRNTATTTQPPEKSSDKSKFDTL